MMASESCSTSSSSSGDDFVPIFLLRKVMKSLRRSYDKKRSTIRWMKQTQLQLKLSPVKTKATRPIELVSACFSTGEHILVSVRRVLREGSRTALRLLFWLCRARGESSLSVERLHVTFAVDLPLLAHFPSVTCSGRRWETFWTWPSAL